MRNLSGNKPLFPRGPGLGLRALALLTLSLGLIFLDQRTEQLRPVRAVLATALQPLVWLASVPYRLGGIRDWTASRQSLLAERDDLQRQLMQLNAGLTRVEALEAENRRIRELLASADRLDAKVLMAEIVGASQDPYRNQIVLNKGTREAVYRGQALVDAFGILGQVIEVRPRSATALLITDPDHGIPVEINRTGFRTIAVGRGDGINLTLPFLPANSDVKVGDLLVSSSLGGRFPSGYPVGEVFEVRYQAGEHFMEAIAAPSAHLHQGRQVLLVWSETAPEDAPPPATPARPAAPP